MLDFYLIDPNLNIPYYDSEGIHVGNLTLADVRWLHEFRIIKSFTNDTYNDLEVEALPFYNDFQIPLETIQQMYNRYANRRKELDKQYLHSDSLEKLGNILEAAMNAKRGLQAICD